MAKVGKILLAVVQIGAIIALNIYAPGLGAALSGALGGAISATVASSIIIAVGTTAIALGGALIGNALFGRKLDMGSSRINFRQAEVPRYIVAGEVLQGGVVAFAEMDASGDLWYLIIHCDSILTSTPQYYLDDVLVTVNSSGQVTTSDFVTSGNINWTIKTYTYTESDPTPGAATTLAAAFPTEWSTVSHMLVGTTYSVIKGRAVSLKNRYKTYKWRGAIGLGEPNVAIFGQWSNMYDPNDETQTLGDRTTYKPSTNAELIWAWWQTHKFGMNKAESTINWSKVAENASICAETVVGIESTQNRYDCAVVATDDTDRATVQNNIMLACDGQLLHDDEGLNWCDVGHYSAPTMTLTRNRDIITMSSVSPEDGESETQGVIVRYSDHNANFTTQPSAPWQNPNYYVEGLGNTYLYVDIPCCYNHNQAMRLAKAIGLRSQPTHKLAPTAGLRGILLQDQRGVNLMYNNEWGGDYELMTPVEIDESGLFCSLALVPLDENRWDLLEGEEKPRPASTVSTSSSTISLPTGVTIAFNNSRIEVTFDEEPRDDIEYVFEYITQSSWTDSDSDTWSTMTTNMDTNFAYSGAVNTSIAYYIRWKTETSGGSSTAYYDPPYSLGAETTVIGEPTDISTSNGTGEIEVTWRNPNDLNAYDIDLYRGTTTTFGDATVITTEVIDGLGAFQSYTDTVSAGTYYYWVVATDGSSLESSPVGPDSATAT